MVKNAEKASYRHRARMHPRRPASGLAERWTIVDGIDVFYRESANPPDARVMTHLHGFGLSGRYLLPTAELLADEFHTLVPDLPGFGRSGKAHASLDIPDLAHAAARFLDDRGIETTSLVGNSMGCPVIVEFAHHYPERIERAVLVSPAGGIHNQPLRRAIGQLAKDGGREPRKMIGVATPDYLRFGVPSTFKMFQRPDAIPLLQRLLELKVPTLVVLGTRDPLMPGPARIKEVASRTRTTCCWSSWRVPRTRSTSAIPTSSRTSSGSSWTIGRSSTSLAPPAPACSRSTGASTTRSLRSRARSAPEERSRQHDVRGRPRTAEPPARACIRRCRSRSR